VPTVALDAFGADRGPAGVLAGARKAAAEGIRVRIFGPADDLADPGDGIEVVPADDWITNEDEPVAAVRSRPQASVVQAANDVADGASDALVSVGSTGATMTASLFAMRRLRGVQRPALAALLPLPAKSVLLLDCGANVEVRPQHLVQFAFLGSTFMESVLGVASPRVGLLSVGEEQKKGTPDVVAASEMLDDAAGINFGGNAEGRDLPAGEFDVVVTDGFTGNIALKLLEGTAKAVGGAVRDAAKSGPVAAAGGLMLRPALGKLRRQLDPDQTGGAILLGLRGVAVVGHGSSSPDGVANAVRLADRTVRERAVERMGEALEHSGATRQALREQDDRDTQAS
jgi:glycerol-3-phosphate acyltransferase PlsX